MPSDLNEQDVYADHQFGIPSRVPNNDSFFPSSPIGLHGAVGEKNTRYKEYPTRSTSSAPSEPAPIDRWFSNLRLDLDETTWTPLARPASTIPATPLLSSSLSSSSLPLQLTADDDPAFKNDLAHVLVWFSDDLTSQQRLVTSFTLSKSLSKWQLEFLIKLLQQEMEGSSPRLHPMDGRVSPLASPIKRSDSASPPAAPWRRVVIPEPSRTIPTRPISWSSTPADKEQQLDRRSSPSSTESLPANATLFYTDLHAWLRLHRLHKYLGTLQAVESRQQLLDLKEEDLELLGVTAQGARRKFARLFELIKAEST